MRNPYAILANVWTYQVWAAPVSLPINWRAGVLPGKEVELA